MKLTKKYLRNLIKEVLMEQHQTFKVGDILYTYNGHDTSGIDFFEVIDIKDNVVYYKEIEQVQVGNGLFKPLKDHWKGSGIYKSIAHNNYLKVDSKRIAYLWDNNPVCNSDSIRPLD